MRRMTASAAMAAVVMAAAGSCLGATIFVDANLAAGANNGTSWANAYQGPLGLTAAIAAAVAGDEIWVADGRYIPDAANRSIAFTLKSGVAIYGGFAGGEAALSERSFTTNIARLSGDLLNNDGGGAFADNSFHVVNGGTANSTASIDGFVIEAGNANGASATDTDRGGGVIFLNGANGRVRNCLIRSNRSTFGGGGIYVRSASPAFEDCIIRDNFGGSFGGGIDFFVPAAPSQTVRFDRCQFITNQAARAGGAEVFGLATMILSNCTFQDNVATGATAGGAVFVGSSASAMIINSTLVANRATTAAAAGVLNSGGSMTINNSILYFNTGVGGLQNLANQISGAAATFYSCVQGIGAGNNNISSNPSLVNLLGGDLRLSAGSACIDAASNSLVGAPAPTFDVGRKVRFRDDPTTADTGAGTAPIVDIGAHEFQPPPPPCPGDANGDQQINAADLSVLLANFGGPAAGPGAGDFNSDGQCNSADLSILLANFGGSC